MSDNPLGLLNAIAIVVGIASISLIVSSAIVSSKFGKQSSGDSYGNMLDVIDQVDSAIVSYIPDSESSKGSANINLINEYLQFKFEYMKIRDLRRDGNRVINKRDRSTIYALTYKGKLLIKRLEAEARILVVEDMPESSGTSD
ncbi:hypothetical protein GCM10022631_22110 [Deinococcus rubellus]|uniref:Uncharacterized protein n=1 Tax=Deinococcus rubellus TaxID=1889240 RepID=A0ABY5YGU8_9DEIO|nr:hypothetical protein [Deinococcus rubellus]UWX64292.1 hypothetical protein N0D28_01045 [Deinococcus rubellus]